MLREEENCEDDVVGWCFVLRAACCAFDVVQ
jgi:hypothetical protein